MTNSGVRQGKARLAALVAAVVAIGGAAACAGAADPPAAGPHLVPVNGRKMAFSVTPGRLPAIVLDAGGGMDSSEWRKVVPELAAKTGSEVIAYDRAGEGKSDEAPGPWRADNAAADLAAGLTQLGVTENVFLVSHSLAGEVAFSFARSHPRWVAGAVFVDANLPQFFTPAETAKLVALNERQVEELKKAPSTRQTRQLLAQADGYGPVHAAYHKLTWPSGIPAAVIVSAETPFPTPEDAQLWRRAQQDFAHAAPNRTLVTAERSSHDVPLDRPDVVVAAVENLLQR
ncbi:alpha/beta fold hydrolase [Amycolatopsis sp. Poz14]|uniref:alpha/beta fold hydrolase n=1 Tax=Amycolatopsis sp. Poz14 TaxID=1447705 RepID=UPI001EE972F4|nr:alpha/beta hydrolase [Amycolatopsis sp. Poz14]MCG3754958.1 alpha/beta hydrolase [Amycolatopsis sp. Poz14]